METLAHQPRAEQGNEPFCFATWDLAIKLMLYFPEQLVQLRVLYISSKLVSGFLSPILGAPGCRPPDCRPPDFKPQVLVSGFLGPNLGAPDCRPPDCRPPDCRPQVLVSAFLGPNLGAPDCRPLDFRPPDCRPPDYRFIKPCCLGSFAARV